MTEIKFPLDVITTGMSRTDNVPWSLITEEIAGLIVIDDTMERLPGTLERLGKESSYALFDPRCNTRLPSIGITFLLDKQGIDYRQVVAKTRNNGFIAFNNKAYYMQLFAITNIGQMKKEVTNKLIFERR